MYNNEEGVLHFSFGVQKGTYLLLIRVERRLVLQLAQMAKL